MTDIKNQHFSKKIKCLLCKGPIHLVLAVRSNSRIFSQCSQCKLIQVSVNDLPDLQTEEKHYNTHINGPQFPGYIKFLNRLVQPMLPLLHKESKGLDFGCGPGPAISTMLQEEGITCDNYDPIYFPISLRSYDFLFATECLEHFHHPLESLIRLNELVNQKGYIGIMTETYQDLGKFKNWYYLQDPTHVIFFHLETIHWMEKKFNWQLIHTDHHRVFIFQKL